VGSKTKQRQTKSTSHRHDPSRAKLVMLSDNANVEQFEQTFLDSLPTGAHAKIITDWSIGPAKGFAGMFWSWSFPAFGSSWQH
jgi:hypothetical protein